MGRGVHPGVRAVDVGSFLRAFGFGHVRQLDAVASRFLLALAGLTRLLGPAGAGVREYALVDVDDTVIEVHGHAKQAAGFGYTRVRGLNALLATLATPASAPVIVAQRLRNRACNSSHGRSGWSATRSDHAAAARPAPARPGANGLGVLRPGTGLGRADRRSSGVGHGQDEHPGQGRDRRDSRPPLDGHRVHRRGVGPDQRPVDLPGRGRRDHLHRVRYPAQVRAGARPVLARTIRCARRSTIPPRPGCCAPRRTTASCSSGSPWKCCCTPGPSRSPISSVVYRSTGPPVGPDRIRPRRAWSFLDQAALYLWDPARQQLGDGVVERGSSCTPFASAFASMWSLRSSYRARRCGVRSSGAVIAQVSVRRACSA
jgi:hypothetical protein